MTSWRLAQYCCVLLTAICIICVYVIYTGDVIGIRHIAQTAWERHVDSNTECSASGRLLLSPIHTADADVTQLSS